MKFLILASIIVLSLIGIVGMPESFALCMENEDWPHAPCIDTNPLSHSEFYNAWYGYYDYKGVDWMEIKKIEMNQVLEKGTLKEWVTDERENRNVYSYYLSRNEIQNQFLHDANDVRIDPDFIIPEGIFELFIYDDETANATLPSGQTIDKFAIRHTFAKVNMDAFDSDTFLFNLFGESITVNKHSVVNSVWKGTTRSSNTVDVYLSISNGVVGGSVNDHLGYFSIHPLGQNDLYIIQEIDRSQYKDEPDGWSDDFKKNNDIFVNSSTVFLIIIVLIGVTIFVIYYKKRRKMKL